jgi:phage shock protein PspC (stress-responsive transcriptional regulator)
VINRRQPTSWLQGLQRPIEGRLVAGVCAALAARFQVDVMLLRLAMLLLGLASGVGLLLYLVGWLVMPQDGDDVPSWRGLGQHLRTNIRGMDQDLRRTAHALSSIWHDRGRSNRWPRPLSRKWVALGLVFMGSVILLQSLGLFAWLGPARSLGLAIIAIGASALVTSMPNWRSRSEKDSDR